MPGNPGGIAFTRGGGHGGLLAWGYICGHGMGDLEADRVGVTGNVTLIVMLTVVVAIVIVSGWL